MVTTLALLYLVAFGIQIGDLSLVFLASGFDHTPPVTVTALFSGLLTKVGVYAVIRIYTLLFIQENGDLLNLLLWVAGFTMVTGVLGAAAQYDFRPLAFLSYHQPDWIFIDGIGFIQR